ncbi:MAG: hypothetical protein IKD86_00795 [Firmicutes bacterium]|nr:hypothetical protein [Bacillota bacterium]
MGFSQSGMTVMVIVILLMILVSIQFTLNQILRELREIKKKSDLRDPYNDRTPYRRREWDE